MEINDVDETFVEREWIGLNKKYEWAKLPAFVTNARHEIMAIPQNFLHNSGLPKPDVSVIEFLSCKLPRMSAEIISSKTKTWFSTDKPNIGYDLLISRSVPSAEFIGRLDEASGQAWFDGARSVVDHRFNDGRDRLPLWIISFWKEVVRCEDLRGLWKDGVAWLDREESRSKGKTPPVLIQRAHELLGSVAWDSRMSYCNGLASTPELAKLLGSFWLSDEHINMMVEVLLLDLKYNPMDKVQLVNLSFTMEIGKVYEKLNLSDPAKKKTWLWKFEQQVKEKILEKLYFPLHIRQTHWIAGMIDFKRRTFSFGMSLKHQCRDQG